MLQSTESSREAVLARLKQQANELRKNLVELCYRGGSVHLGGSLSSAEILTALWMHEMRYDPQSPRSEGRDRFFLSKGHIAAALYLVQAMVGFYDIEEVFSTFNQLDSRFGTHPCSEHLRSIEISSGSLGHGLSISVGSSLTAKRRGQSHYTYCLMGDGEIQEGSVWEAAMAAANYELDHLIAFVDHNRISNDGFIEEYMKLEPVAWKWCAFGWDVIEIDGNDIAQVVDAIDAAKAKQNRKPTLILANTVKGKGVSFMENTAMWHVGTIDQDIRDKAMQELCCESTKEEAVK